ncbi:unnamed protein product [Periconia digitata]|uniref:Uncharacterized protein n=1 Tax=Periconia digitata TaxID=1303443 RepID=A0A9W4U2Z1_9PLEO|nr:unnamed protein product [Periconia digitata]
MLLSNRLAYHGQITASSYMFFAESNDRNGLGQRPVIARAPFSYDLCTKNPSTSSDILSSAGVCWFAPSKYIVSCISVETFLSLARPPLSCTAAMHYALCIMDMNYFGPRNASPGVTVRYVDFERFMVPDACISDICLVAHRIMSGVRRATI